MGLAPLHAYAILDCREVTGNDGKKAQIIKIRNPWGQIEWKGDWSDTSKKWTKELKKELGIVVCDDGVFWISLKDFMKYFYFFFLCKYVPGNIFSGMLLPVTK